jgi:hypothetical protein
MDKNTLLAFSCKPLAVDVPEVGIVHLRAWTVREREEYAHWHKDNTENATAIYSKVLALSICDEAGKRLLDDTDLDKLAYLPAKIADYLCTQAIGYNQLSEDSVKDAKKN